MADSGISKKMKVDIPKEIDVPSFKRTVLDK
jgi:hypothetical protein